MRLLHLLSVRLRRITLVTFCSFVGIIVYLFHLQITQMNRYFHLGQKNFVRHEKIASPRGNIVDVHGTILATNSPRYTCLWQGTGNKVLTKHQRTMLTTLSTLFSLTEEKITQIKTAERRAKRLTLSTNIPFEHLRRIIEQFPDEKNIAIEKSYTRYYPQKELACHVVGYLGLDKDTVGKTGLEFMYNHDLKGQSGTMLTIINATGHHLKAHQVSRAFAGKTVQTTLDANLQRIAEDVFPSGLEGCCLVMDESGALEVIVSRPSFDPSSFAQPLSASTWKKLKEKKGFLNRAFSACYPPASLFKLVTLSAALETGLISKDMCWHCIGYTTFKGRAYHCNNRAGHGILSTEQALAYSCNIPFYEIGKKIPIDTLADYAHRWGLGTKTGILFPEQAGLIPTTAWKKRVRKERWWQGETVSATIGQSSLLVTPLQITCLISALCTGYRVRPRILVDEAILKEPVEISNETLMFLRQCLSSVINKGTGSTLKHLNDFTIHGKSGTAQVQSLDKKKISKKNLSHGYFAIHFQYKNEKPRTLFILLEHAGSPATAKRFAITFLKRYAAITEQKDKKHQT